MHFREDFGKYRNQMVMNVIVKLYFKIKLLYNFYMNYEY